MAEQAPDLAELLRRKEAEKIREILLHEEVKKILKELDLALDVAEREVRKQSPNHKMLEKAMPVIVKRFYELEKRGIHPITEERKYRRIRAEIDRWT